MITPKHYMVSCRIWEIHGNMFFFPEYWFQPCSSSHASEDFAKSNIAYWYLWISMLIDQCTELPTRQNMTGQLVFERSKLASCWASAYKVSVIRTDPSVISSLLSTYCIWCTLVEHTFLKSVKALVLDSSTAFTLPWTLTDTNTKCRPLRF